MAKAGGWVLLQNVHLMQSWLVHLERKLDALADVADVKFRCFISAEPPPLPYLKNIPEGLLQSSLKVRVVQHRLVIPFYS
jgi:dynein heavy chain